MDEAKDLKDAWGVKLCPLLNRQCQQNQCAWWIEEEKMCAVKKIKVQ